MHTPERLSGLRESLAILTLSDDALVRTAARLATTELDLADAAADPEPHHRQIALILDAVLNPEETTA